MDESKKRDLEELNQDSESIKNEDSVTETNEIKKVKLETSSDVSTTTTTEVSNNITPVNEEDEEDGGDDDEDEDENATKKRRRGNPLFPIPPLLTKDELIALQAPNKLTNEKTKKKKVAMVVGYSGTAYKGMQKNPGFPTIEDELEKAIFKVGGISPDNMYCHRKIDWIRCARTDKGVSAIRNIVSFKLEYDPPTLDEMKTAINAQLPSDIKVFGIKRVNNTFHSKNCVDRRSYIYITPTFAFDPIFANNKLTEPYKFTELERQRLNSVLKLFLGTRRFHNYTSKKESNDPSANRTINSFVCSEPFVIEGVEMVEINIVGQSFMLHQIRKMIGVTMSFMRKGLFVDSKSDEEALETMKKYVDATFAHRQFNLPMAPGTGLLLDRCLYDIWTQKFSSVHGDLMFNEYAEEIESFKKDRIYKEIALFEAEKQLFKTWFQECLDPYPLPYEDLISTFENPPPVPPRTKKFEKGPRERVPAHRQIKYLGREEKKTNESNEIKTEEQQKQISITAQENA